MLSVIIGLLILFVVLSVENIFWSHQQPGQTAWNYSKLELRSPQLYEVK